MEVARTRMSGREGLRLLPFFLALLLAVRFAFVLARLARDLPEGPVPVLRFALAAAVLCAAPGLALLRLLRPDPATRLPRALFVLSTSLAASGFAYWLLFFLGLGSRPAALALLAALAAAGVWGAAPLLSRDAVRDAVRALPSVPLSRSLPALAAAVFLEGVFESVLGQPFRDWDALISWDKWAADAAGGAPLRRLLAGGYPQLLPALHGAFYALAGTPASAVFPAEQLLLHGLTAVWPALLLLALHAALRERPAAFLAAAALAASAARLIEPINPLGLLANGYADLPLAAMAAAAAALAPALCAPPADGRSRLPAATAFALPLFGTVFLKANGIPLAALAAALGAIAGGRRAWRTALPALAFAAALAAPHYARQFWLAAHPEACADDPFLLSFPLHTAHTRLFTPNLAHLRAWLRALSAALAPLPGSAAIAGAALCLAAAAVRRATRAAALAAAALLAFWFFTASYDARGAMPALFLAAFAAARALDPAPALRAALRGGAPRRPLAAAAAIPGFALLAAALVLFAGSGTADALKRPFIVRRWQTPKTALIPPETRHMAKRPAGDLRNILFAAPWAARAEHVWTGDTLCRVLAPKGCYTLQRNAWRHARPGDLFVQGSRQPRPPAGFVPIAELRRARGYRALWMFRPDLLPGAVLERPAPPPGESVGRDLFGPAAEDDPFAPYLAPVRDGSVLRLPNPHAPNSSWTDGPFQVE